MSSKTPNSSAGLTVVVGRDAATRRPQAKETPKDLKDTSAGHNNSGNSNENHGNVVNPASQSHSSNAPHTPIHQQLHNHLSVRRPSLLRSPSSANGASNASSASTAASAASAASAAAYAAAASSGGKDNVAMAATSSITTHNNNLNNPNNGSSNNTASIHHNGGVKRTPSGGNSSTARSLSIRTSDLEKQPQPNTLAPPTHPSAQSMSRTRSRSLTLTLNQSLHFASPTSATSSNAIQSPNSANPVGYVTQERAYLRKIRNQMVDDYYTKGISGAQDDDDDDDETIDGDTSTHNGTMNNNSNDNSNNNINNNHNNYYNNSNYNYTDSNNQQNYYQGNKNFGTSNKISFYNHNNNSNLNYSNYPPIQGQKNISGQVNRSNSTKSSKSNDSDTSTGSINDFQSNYATAAYNNNNSNLASNSNNNYNSDLLADIDEDKYQIDFSLALSMMSSNSANSININPQKNLLQLLKDNTDDPAVIERLEWQSMLTSVLTGDVVRSEKTKIIQTNPENEQELFAHITYKEDLWFGILAKLYNRTEDDQRKIIAYRRTLVDAVLDEIMTFEVNYDKTDDKDGDREDDDDDDSNKGPSSNNGNENSSSEPIESPRDQVVSILDKWEKCCDQWRTMEEMKNDKPLCRTVEFQDRIDALNAWLSITDAIKRAGESFRVWIGNDEMDITKGSSLNEAQPKEDGTSSSISSSSTASSATAIVTPNTSTTPSTNSNATTATGKSKNTPRTDNAPVFDDDSRSLAERLMKEKDVQLTFNKRIFSPLAPWMIKSKDNYIRLGPIFESLKLPDYIHDLIQLCLIPAKLIKEIISVRLKYAMRLQNPTLMMIDQMIDDFKSYITVALEVKLVIVEYCKPDPEKNWYIREFFENERLDFDRVILQCVKYFLGLLNRKLLDLSRSPTNFRTFKEPEELEETWYFLKCLGAYIDGGSVVVAEQITLLTLKLIHRLLAYLNNQIRHPPHTPATSASDLIRWYSSTTENFGQLRRKLARFAGEISRDFTNLLVFDMPSTYNNRTKNFLEVLRLTNHFLVYTGTVETQGIYFFASSELMGDDEEILRFINGGYVGVGESELKLEFVDLLRAQDSAAAAAAAAAAVTSSTLINNGIATATTNAGVLPSAYRESTAGLASTPTDHAYVLAICPPKAIVWEGQVYNLSIDEVPITDISVGQMLMITKLPYDRLHEVREKFVDIVLDVMMIGGMIKPMEQRCSLARVHYDLTRVTRSFFKMSLLVLDSVQIVRAKCLEIAPKGDFQELINNYFVYARGYVKNSVKTLDLTRKSAVIMKLMQLSIEWVSFICDDCIPTDRRTFRWCVLALEFAMDMTKGFNVFVLNEDQFYKLKLKVARCMSLLISHFDIMGARSSEAEKKRMLKWTSSRTNTEDTDDDEMILSAYREDIMKQIQERENYRKELESEQQSVGRVLDISDLEYQFVTLLASSFSSVSIRWQKGRFIGGGLFGNVYAAVNLDTGGVMAVKEIRFHDSQSIKNIVPSIKDEMTVLEMLNHPNVVQYFGVEVHRDKVYIFMEFCEGGSLSGLLTHGRIEDEMVTQYYTLQMLEGLAYLHQSGVVHRDVKPENILLDHNGVIKFVDFGAAKVIANTGRTIRGTTTNSNKNNSIKSSSDKDNQEDGEVSPLPTEPSPNAANPPFGNNLNSMTGTPMYMSPEVITGVPTSGNNGVIDIWALGCCILEMATGRRPWAQLDNEWAIMYHIAAGNMPQLPSPDQLSEKGRAFIARCLEHDPKKRPSAMELLNDPWMVEIRQYAFDSSDTVSTPSSEDKSSLT